MKAYLLLTTMLFAIETHSQTLQYRNETTAAIDSIVNISDSLFKSYKKVFNDKKEKWEYYHNKKILVFQMTYGGKSQQNTDIYYLLNNKLIFAREKEVSFFNQKDSVGWSCDYYLKNNKLLYLESLGHGKSEDDNWQPQKEIMEQFKKRYAYLCKIMK